MSLVISGTNAIITIFLLMGLNGFFCFKRIPILALPICAISILFLIVFQIEYTGLNLILVFILVILVFGSVIQNLSSFRSKN